MLSAVGRRSEGRTTSYQVLLPAGLRSIRFAGGAGAGEGTIDVVGIVGSGIGPPIASAAAGAATGIGAGGFKLSSPISMARATKALYLSSRRPEVFIL